MKISRNCPNCKAHVLRWKIVAYFMISFVSCHVDARREVILKHHGVVATDDGRCSRVGSTILREGGHAIDASVAVSLCLGVVSPASSGIGGGAFMLVRSGPDRVARAFDMRETAPILASKDMFSGDSTLKASGTLSIAVPGELAGLYKAWAQYEKLPWKRLFGPAENLARRGFKVSPYLHMQMTSSQAGIVADDGLHAVYAPNGRLLRPGETCRNEKLVMTLRQVSRHGVGPFYNGSIELRLVDDVRKADGILKMEDLQRYRVKVRDPISTDVFGLKILGMPPPSSGGASMALILNILAQYGARLKISESLSIHREIEALKHASAMRMNLGDPDFVDIRNVLADMINPKFIKALKKTIYDNMTFGPRHYSGRWNQIKEHGTSHLSIVDKKRNAVSLTSTINAYFGAKILSLSTGIVLNNEMDDFSIPSNVSKNVLPAAPANFIIPGKRPLSSMTPTIILKDEKLKAVLGASGGTKIIAGTTEVLVNYFVKGMDPFYAVMTPRAYQQLIPNVVQYENWTTVSHDHIEMGESTRAALLKKGHVLESVVDGSICQLVVEQLKN